MARLNAMIYGGSQGRYKYEPRLCVTILVLLLILKGVNAKQTFDNSHLQGYEVVWPQPQAFDFKSASDGNVSNFWISKWQYDVVEPNMMSRAGLMHIALSFSRYNASMHMLLSAPEYTRVQYKSFRETAHVGNPLAPITVGYELKIRIKIASNKEFGSLQRNEHESVPGMGSAYHYTLQHGNYDESYEIQIVEAEAENNNTLLCDITANTVWGVKHAFTTLEQLFVHDNQNRLLLHPSISGLPLKLKDWPRYPYRGLLIDTARRK